MDVRRLLAVGLAVLLLAGVAEAAADLARGEAALKQAYERSEGDEGGHEATLVRQCRVEGDSVVRCVIVHSSGNSPDLPSHDYYETRTPVDYGVATFGPDDQITTSREPFEEVPRALDADIRIRERLSWGSRPLTVSVAPDVPAEVTIRAWVGRREIRRPRATPQRIVEVAAGRSTVALKLSRAQRTRIRRRLREGRSIRAVVVVSVDGDVGPAIAGETRVADVRVVR